MQTTKRNYDQELNEAIKGYKSPTIKEFRAFPKYGKRIAIAKDVLLQIQKKKIKPVIGTWVEFNKFGSKYINRNQSTNVDQDARNFLNKSEVKCVACALGSLMLGCTLLNNKSQLSDLDDEYANVGSMVFNGDKFSNDLNKFFSYQELKEIEYIFEQGNGWFSDWRMDGASVALDSYLKFNKFSRLSARKKLINIMLNIIKNRGTFTY